MFLNCPVCGYLVALDRDGLPLPRCPNCATRLRAEPPARPPAGAEPRPIADKPVAGKPASTPPASTPLASTDAGDQATPDIAPDTRLLPAPRPRAADTPQRGSRRGAKEIASRAGEQVIPLPAPPANAPAAVTTRAASTSPPTPPAPVPVADTPTRNESHAASAMTVADVIAAIESTRPTAAPPPPPWPPSPRLQPRASAPPEDAREDTPSSASTGAKEDVAATPTPPADASPAATATTAPDPFDEGDDAVKAATEESVVTAAPATSAMPSFARPAAPVTPTERHGHRLQIAAIVALSLLLALQLLLAQRTRLAADAGWRPFVSGMCTLLRCTLPPWHEPSAFTMLERNVRERPGRDGVLRVTATFRNDAHWPQSWPLLHLTLSDVDGLPIAERDFTPREYLGGVQAQASLGSGQRASVAFDVVAPSKPVVAFTFDFR